MKLLEKANSWSFKHLLYTGPLYGQCKLLHYVYVIDFKQFPPDVPRFLEKAEIGKGFNKFFTGIGPKLSYSILLLFCSISNPNTNF